VKRACIVLACALPLVAACTTQPQPPSRAAAPTPVHVDADTLFRGVADAMPDYADFLTIDELR